MTPAALQSVRDSVTHWQTDIRARLLTGDMIIASGHTLGWILDGAEVKMWSEHCPLCIYVNEVCELCPYTLHHGERCNEVWAAFRVNPTLENCDKMIAALEAILEVHGG